MENFDVKTVPNDFYEAVRNECDKMDAIYEDYIVLLVGVTGLQSLIENELIESCGSVRGRKLYSLATE